MREVLNGVKRETTELEQSPRDIGRLKVFKPRMRDLLREIERKTQEI